MLVKNKWLLTASFLVILFVVSVLMIGHLPAQDSSPWDFIPEKTEGMDHSMFISEPFETPQAVTDTCLSCHGDVAEKFMMTSHWTWVSSEVVLPGGTEPVPFGKINSINNFCVAVPSNWGRCTQCHAGYGWKDDTFDFTNPSNIDCLVCHDTSGLYKKDPKTAGMPMEGVDLLASAQSVGKPSRMNCGECHFKGGGGDAVKHGDLDMTMVDCPPETDVHMGVHDFACQDCHMTTDHMIKGRLPWLNNDSSASFDCAMCHTDAPHEADQLNKHTDVLACQVCHIPTFAAQTPTKVHWDWSTAGLEEAPDERKWDRKKGSFQFATNAMPEYYWWDGTMANYLPGQEMDPAVETALNMPNGDITDPNAKIWPFKVHRGRQPFDSKLNHILVPKLFGKDGFWNTWDWDQSFELGAKASGVAYSGEYGFAETAMYWPLNHMVQASADSLTCMECHGAEGRMPWAALGYSGDPMVEGGR